LTIVGALGGEVADDDNNVAVPSGRSATSTTATATVACTDDDVIVETKEYNLVGRVGDENNAIGNKLVLLLLRRPNDDVERREARDKEKTERVAAMNARKWNKWMVSGRKVRDGDDDNDVESDSLSSTLELLLSLLSLSSSLDGIVNGKVERAGSERRHPRRRHRRR
jgi:hypothetical protein